MCKQIISALALLLFSFCGVSAAGNAAGFVYGRDSSVIERSDGLSEETLEELANRLYPHYREIFDYYYGLECDEEDEEAAYDLAAKLNALQDKVVVLCLQIPDYEGNLYTDGDGLVDVTIGEQYSYFVEALEKDGTPSVDINLSTDMKKMLRREHGFIAYLTKVVERCHEAYPHLYASVPGGAAAGAGESSTVPSVSVAAPAPSVAPVAAVEDQAVSATASMDELGAIHAAYARGNR